MRFATLIILGLLAGWGLLRDVANTANGGSIDLRNRVTGARVAAEKVDPYTYKWRPGEPQAFCDVYNEPGALFLSKTTVTPWVLAGHSLVNGLNYRHTQWLWLFFTYGTLVAALLLWRRSMSERSTADWGIVLVLLYSLSPSWRHHVDHGQIYSVYAACFILLVWLSLRQQRSSLVDISEGLLCGMLLGCRPTLIGAAAPAALARRWTTLVAIGLGGLIVFIVPTILFGPPIWQQYREAMELHSEIYLNQMRPSRGSMSYPNTIEGIPLEVIAGLDRTIPFADTSIYRLVSFSLPAMVLLAVWGIAMLATVGYLSWRRAGSAAIWWAVAAWIVLGDFLLPAYRHTYNDVLAIPMVCCGLIALQGHRGLTKVWLIATAAVFGMMLLGWQLTARWYLPTPSVAMAVLGGLALVLAVVISKRRIEKI